jgi:hypothetical protein
LREPSICSTPVGVEALALRLPCFSYDIHRESILRATYFHHYRRDLGIDIDSYNVPSDPGELASDYLAKLERYSLTYESS